MAEMRSSDKLQGPSPRWRLNDFNRGGNGSNLPLRKRKLNVVSKRHTNNVD